MSTPSGTETAHPVPLPTTETLSLAVEAPACLLKDL